MKVSQKFFCFCFLMKNITTVYFLVKNITTWQLHCWVFIQRHPVISCLYFLPEFFVVSKISLTFSSQIYILSFHLKLSMFFIKTSLFSVGGRNFLVLTSVTSILPCDSCSDLYSHIGFL